MHRALGCALAGSEPNSLDAVQHRYASMLGAACVHKSGSGRPLRLGCPEATVNLEVVEVSLVHCSSWSCDDLYL